MTGKSPRHCVCQAAAGLLLLFAGGCAAPPASAQAAAVPPIPPGDARFWFYRVFFPEDSGGMPAVAMNGATIGYALAGTRFYRDVPAGPYRLTVQSSNWDYYQSQDVAVAPGQEVYVKISSLPSWNENPFNGYRSDTYYVTLPPPGLVALQVPHTRVASGY